MPGRNKAGGLTIVDVCVNLTSGDGGGSTRMIFNASRLSMTAESVATMASALEALLSEIMRDTKDVTA